MERFTKGEWSIERHGAGFALYAGRTGMAHGLNLFNIVEPDKNFESNAALIAVAPEMYDDIKRDIDWLKKMRSLFVIGSDGFRACSLRIESKQKLLAKARGEQ